LGKKTSWFTLSTTQCKEIETIGMRSGWKRLSQESLPSILPSDLRKKVDTAVMIAAPTSTGGTYLVYNNLRVDHKAGAIDQHPFALIVHSTGPSASGMLIHHGKWKERTTNPPKAFWDHVNESGVGNYFYTNPPSGLSSGTLDQLPENHREAFEHIITRIRSGPNRGWLAFSKAEPVVQEGLANPLRSAAT